MVRYYKDFRDLTNPHDKLCNQNQYVYCSRVSQCIKCVGGDSQWKKAMFIRCRPMDLKAAEQRKKAINGK